MTSSLPRALVVLAMSLGFYLFAFVIAGALFWLPWAQVKYEHHVGAAGILCAIAGAWLVFALLPRRVKFEAPGQPLALDEHIRLCALVNEVAALTGEPTPDEIYLVPEATAFTFVRRKWLGLKRLRIIGIGLPLLATFTREELAAVIAHEFGHHRGGDLRVTPWLTGTRRALARTLDDLADSILWLHLPFIWYARWFLRVTFKLSREQELAADALAARTVGAEHMASALARLHQIGPQWSVYWEQEVLPVLSSGHRPPLLEGFSIFQREASEQPALAKAFREARDRSTSEHDTHPALSERLAALGIPNPTLSNGGGSAALLLDSARDVELRTLAAVIKPEVIDSLNRLGWEQVPRELWLPRWRETLVPHQQQLAGLRLTSLPDVLRERGQWAQRMRQGVASLSPEAERRWVTGLMGTWLAVQLVDLHGFEVDTLPGRPICLRHGDLILTPHDLVKRIAEGAEGVCEFQELLAQIARPSTGIPGAAVDM